MGSGKSIVGKRKCDDCERSLRRPKPELGNWRFYLIHPCTAVPDMLHWHKAYISYFPGQFGRLEILIHFRRSMLFPY